MGGCPIDPKKSRREHFQGVLALGIFWGGVSRYATIQLFVALSPGHSDITRFRKLSPIATNRNYVDRAEKISNLLKRLTPLTFLIRVQAFWDPFYGEVPHVQIIMNDGPSPLM